MDGVYISDTKIRTDISFAIFFKERANYTLSILLLKITHAESSYALPHQVQTVIVKSGFVMTGLFQI